jgi:tetratricopeptide (TPR) repeat protein
MAITSRLVSKAGNYQQAEQIYQIAANNFNNHEYNCKEITWSTPYTKYLTAVSLAEAALDLGLWDQADRYVNQLVQTAPDEPLTHLLRAKISICKAEFYHLCENVDVTIHKPAVECASKDAYMLVNSFLECAKHNLDKYPQIINQDGWQATDETIDRWHSRAIIAFNDYTEFTPDPVEKLSTHHAPGDATACIYRLHQIDMRSPERDSIAKVIKIARSYPRNPAVLIQVALAICDDNL